MMSRRVMRCVAAAALAGATGAGALGCLNQDNARPLTADAFVSRRIEGRADPQPIDQPGHVISDGVRAPAYEGTDAPEVTLISPSVRDVVGGPGAKDRARAGAKPQATTPQATTRSDAGAPAATAKRASTAPAPSDAVAAANGATDPSGQYVIFGAVLAEVNNHPIYAHKVLTILDSALRAEAQQYDARGFRPVAMDLISRQIGELVREELVFAAAQKALTERERTLADALTAQWRNAEVTRAGGSLELAKRSWADQGWDFDERTEYQYRIEMNRVYFEKRIVPLVQVTASDIRRYYDANQAQEFTTQARAKFRVIKIDSRNPELGVATPDEAKRLAEQIRIDGVKGNFAALARQQNDPTLKESGGLVGTDDGWLLKGSYVSEKLEDAVWNLAPGQVTNVIEDGGAFYLARLEERQDAESLPFENLSVQERILRTLKSQQLLELQDREQNRLKREAVIREQPGMRQTVLDMAMQRYPTWASAR